MVADVWHVNQGFHLITYYLTSKFRVPCTVARNPREVFTADKIHSPKQLLRNVLASMRFIRGFLTVDKEASAIGSCEVNGVRRLWLSSSHAIVRDG